MGKRMTPLCVCLFCSYFLGFLCSGGWDGVGDWRWFWVRFGTLEGIGLDFWWGYVSIERWAGYFWLLHHCNYRRVAERGLNRYISIPAELPPLVAFTGILGDNTLFHAE